MKSVSLLAFGVGCVLLSKLFCSIGGLSVQALDKLVPVFQLNVFRLIGKIILSVIHLTIPLL